MSDEISCSWKPCSIIEDHICIFHFFIKLLWCHLNKYYSIIRAVNRTKRFVFWYCSSHILSNSIKFLLRLFILNFCSWEPSIKSSFYLKCFFSFCSHLSSLSFFCPVKNKFCPIFMIFFCKYWWFYASDIINIYIPEKFNRLLIFVWLRCNYLCFIFFLFFSFLFFYSIAVAIRSQCVRIFSFPSFPCRFSCLRAFWVSF